MVSYGGGDRLVSPPLVSLFDIPELYISIQEYYSYYDIMKISRTLDMRHTV